MDSTFEVHTQVRKVLERFNNLVSTKNPEVLKEFSSGDEALLIGSESGEIARGSQEIEAFFSRIFTREATFSWEWNRIDVSHAGNLARFFTDGWAIFSDRNEQRKTPYRITGVLKREGKRWLWMQYHGSEPVIAK